MHQNFSNFEFTNLELPNYFIISLIFYSRISDEHSCFIYKVWLNQKYVENIHLHIRIHLIENSVRLKILK